MKIVIAIGGSILLQSYDYKKFQEYSDILKKLNNQHELFVVVGGGKPARDYINIVRELNAGEAQCDDIGIEVTRINAKLLLTSLGDVAYQKIPHNFQEALEYSAIGKIIVMGGTEPAHSTDAVSAILAEYVKADMLINLTSVDGMYTKDPNKYDDAELIDEITAEKMLDFISGKDTKAGTYEFFDMTAIQMIKRSSLKTVIANGYDSQNLLKIINGEKIGTKIVPKK
ncbi:UMP kinase [Methanobrevibacter sp. OttesenSCG-928-K11]|nr:UMP kinase [Methanobrevibacter sp. OttesenSCG-928-K11]MDL2271147.1 UMP kinase [Methanobrevibacter sp. OttesenSCG-928-I08]